MLMLSVRKRLFFYSHTVLRSMNWSKVAPSLFFQRPVCRCPTDYDTVPSQSSREDPMRMMNCTVWKKMRWDENRLKGKEERNKNLSEQAYHHYHGSSITIVQTSTSCRVLVCVWISRRDMRRSRDSRKPGRRLMDEWCGGQRSVHNVQSKLKGPKSFLRRKRSNDGTSDVIKDDHKWKH